MLLVPYMWASITFLPYMWATMTFWPLSCVKVGLHATVKNVGLTLCEHEIIRVCLHYDSSTPSWPDLSVNSVIRVF